MMMRTTVSAAALALFTAGAASAQTAQATASTDLNLRAGPGPNFEVIDVINGGDAVSLAHCLEARNWCEVTFDGTTGWAYADYLNTQVQGEPVAIYEARDRGAFDIRTTTVETAAPTAAQGVADVAASGAGGAAAGAATGALAGALLGPVGVGAGAAIGAAAGAGLGAANTVAEYVTENPVDQVYLEGEVVTGAGVPEGINLYEIPESEYRYAYINEVPVVVATDNRRIVHIVR